MPNATPDFEFYGLVNEIANDFTLSSQLSEGERSSLAVYIGERDGA
jgi:hypothetical protein